MHQRQIIQPCSRCFAAALAVLIWFVGLNRTSADDTATSQQAVFDQVRAALVQGGLQKTKMLGFSITKLPFEEKATDGSLLVGFELGIGKFLDKEMIYALRTIYRTPRGEIWGKAQGEFTIPPSPEKWPRQGQEIKTVQLRARPGYAVGAVKIRSDLYLLSMKVTFMRVLDGRLDPSQAYVKEWIGNRETGREDTVGGDGSPVVGIFGNKDERRILALGLITVPPLDRQGSGPSRGSRPEKGTAKPERTQRPAAVAPVPEKPETAPARPARATEPPPSFYRNATHHFSMELPTGWTEMSDLELARLNELMQKRSLGPKVEYAAGFRPANSAIGTFPYILLQVQKLRAADISEEELQRALGFRNKQSMKAVEGPFADVVKDLSADQPVLDKTRHRIYLRTELTVFGVGKVQGHSVCHLGSDALVALHSYATEESLARLLPTFEGVNNSFAFDSGFQYPTNRPSSGLSGMLLALVFLGVSAVSFVVLLVVVGSRRPPRRRDEDESVLRPASDWDSSAPIPYVPPDPNEPVWAVPVDPTDQWPTNEPAQPRSEPKAASLEHFHALALFTWSPNRYYRVYAMPGELWFLESGPSRFDRQTQDAGATTAAIMGGLVGALIYSMVHSNRSKADDPRRAMMDRASLPRLREMLEETSRNFRMDIEGIEEASLEAPSLWRKLRYGGQQVEGYLALRHRDRGRYMLALTTQKEYRAGVKILSSLLDSRFKNRAYS